jgi:hypothetical protein
MSGKIVEIYFWGKFNNANGWNLLKKQQGSKKYKFERNCSAHEDFKIVS